jgi:hypothetical protein
MAQQYFNVQVKAGHFLNKSCAAGIVSQHWGIKSKGCYEPY